jgi:hypothetical protein
LAGAREGLAMPWSHAARQVGYAKPRSAAQPDGASKPRLRIAASRRSASTTSRVVAVAAMLRNCAARARSCAAVRSAMGTKFTSIAGRYPNNRINSTKKCDYVGAFTAPWVPSPSAWPKMALAPQRETDLDSRYSIWKASNNGHCRAPPSRASASTRTATAVRLMVVQSREDVVMNTNDDTNGQPIVRRFSHSDDRRTDKAPRGRGAGRRRQFRSGSATSAGRSGRGLISIFFHPPLDNGRLQARVATPNSRSGGTNEIKNIVVIGRLSEHVDAKFSGPSGYCPRG